MQSAMSTSEDIRLSNMGQTEMLGYRLGQLVSLVQAQSEELAKVREELAFLREGQAIGQNTELDDNGELGEPLDMCNCPVNGCTCGDTSGNEWGDDGAGYSELAIDNILAEHARKYGATSSESIAEELGLHPDAAYGIAGYVEETGAWEVTERSHGMNGGCKGDFITGGDVSFNCDDLGAYLEYSQGLKQVYRGYTQTSYTKPDGGKGFLKYADQPDSHYFNVAAWLSREAYRRGEIDKANRYGQIAISGGISLNEVRCG